MAVKEGNAVTDWGDKEDDMTEAIEASHPVRSGRYKTYERALDLVSNRHSKSALVALVNHLLILAQRES